MKVVNMHEAKTQLSRLVDEEFVIARNGRPVARVTPIVDSGSRPRLGFLPSIRVPDDFDDMAAEEIAALFGSR